MGDSSLTCWPVVVLSHADRAPVVPALFPMQGRLLLPLQAAVSPLRPSRHQPHSLGPGKGEGGVPGSAAPPPERLPRQQSAGSLIRRPDLCLNPPSAAPNPMTFRQVP